MIETNTILIQENPQSVYTLELKDGKPFNGYEVTEEKLLNEFSFVNYYENGILKIKYAVDFLAKDQYETPFEYTLKTTYTDGVVTTGNVYRPAENGFLLTDQYLNGEKVGLILDLFEMHYFNRITFKIEKNQLVIKSFESKDEIRIYKKDNWVLADYYINGEMVQQSEPILIPVTEGSPLSNSAFYYDANKKLRRYTIKMNEDRKPLINDELLSKLYVQFSFEYAGEIEQLLHRIDRYFSTDTTEKQASIETIFEDLAIPYTQQTIVAFVNYNEVGQPFRAVLFNNTHSDRYQQFTEIAQEITDSNTIAQLLHVLNEDSIQ